MTGHTSKCHEHGPKPAEVPFYVTAAFSTAAAYPWFRRALGVSALLRTSEPDYLSTVNR